MCAQRLIRKVNLNNGGVLVRMYDIGFGDCFIIAYKYGESTKKILVDCGSIAKRNTSSSEIVKNLVDDIRDEDGVPRIDVVIATHRHKDHVSGFSKSDWDKVEVKEVWMPWTENPKDDDATRIRDTQAGFAFSLQNYLGFDDNINLEELGDRPNAEILTLNALSNERAMNTLHNGFMGNPKRRFLPLEGTIGETMIDNDLLPGVVTHVLGPSKDESVIRDMDPPSDQSYIALSGGGSSDGASAPFSPGWAIPNNQGNNEFKQFSESDRESLHELNQGLSEEFAVALDKAVNGTSLMLMFHLNNQFLLFPGDAQWGTWNAVLNNREARKLLAKTTFYKIGHHCSHNATPIEFIDKVLGKEERKNRSAMVSVRPRSQWPEIPRKELLINLKSKFKHIARSDNPPQTGFRINENIFVERTLRLSG